MKLEEFLIWLYISMSGKSLNPWNFFKFLKCPALSNLQAQRFLNIANGERDWEEQAERKIEETTREVSDHDNWPSFALFRFLHADTVTPHSNVSDRCYPAVPGEGWRKVEVLPHVNCARFHSPLLAPIFLALAPGGGNGKPSKYLGASIYPRASGRKREHPKKRQNRDEQRGKKGGKGRRRVLPENSFFAGVIPKNDCWRGGTSLKTGWRKTDLPIGIIRVVIFLENDVSCVSLSEIIIAGTIFSYDGNASVSLHHDNPLSRS